MPNAFSQRSRGYRAGTILLYVASILALWGVVAPGWLALDLPGSFTNRGYSGLWFACSGEGYSGCVSIDMTDLDGDFYVTEVLCVVGVILLFFSVLFSAIKNFCGQTVDYRRGVHVLAIWGGIKLFVGTMVFVAYVSRNDLLVFGATYGPSFGLTITGAILSIVAGALIAANNRPPFGATATIVGATQPGAISVVSTTQQQQQQQYMAGSPQQYGGFAAAPPPYQQAAGAVPGQYGYGAPPPQQYPPQQYPPQQYPPQQYPPQYQQQYGVAENQAQVYYTSNPGGKS